MSDGIGCICAARSEGECCCDVDWTPQELIDARAEIERLRVERDALKKDAAALWMMLDDIDTGGDIAKADDVLYRAIAERSHKRRFEPRFEWVMQHIDAEMEESK